MVVLAHLASLRTRKDPTARLDWKWNLTRALYERGHGREDILELIRFIDWLLRLPPELAEVFTSRLMTFEEERKMVYVTQGEELAQARGRQEGRQEGLQALQGAVLVLLKVRFGPVSEALAERVRGVEDLAMLEALVQRAETAATLEDLFPGTSS